MIIQASGHVHLTNKVSSKLCLQMQFFFCKLSDINIVDIPNMSENHTGKAPETRKYNLSSII